VTSKARGAAACALVVATAVAVAVAVAVAAVLPFAVPVGAQSDHTDADLEVASGGRVVRVGPATSGARDGDRAGRHAGVAWPLERYVARVLAGEAEPDAADAAVQALAIAIRTFALANADRHAADGFDLCDGTHCQVPRAATGATRRAAMATLGQILTWNGAPAEVFYSASCGGYSEGSEFVWSGAGLPYLSSGLDDVHRDDAAWSVELSLGDVQRALARVGFRGQISDVAVDTRSPSGRATRLRVPGLKPAAMTGEQFRAAIGYTTVRSTLFSIERRGTALRVTGYGYGHGVGMCVVGAGRRATRGEGVQQILAQYFPGLDVTRLGQRSLD
jgi:stage II sporulation protein D